MKKLFCWLFTGHRFPKFWDFEQTADGYNVTKTCTKCGYKTQKCHDLHEEPGIAEIAIIAGIIAVLFLIATYIKYTFL